MLDAGVRCHHLQDVTILPILNVKFGCVIGKVQIMLQTFVIVRVNGLCHPVS